MYAKENKIISELIYDLKQDQLLNDISLYKIYGIVNPLNNELFYIGCTKEPVYIRIYSHIREYACSPGDKPSKHEIIQNLISQNIKPIVLLMYSIEDKILARNIEKYLIHFSINNKHKVNLSNRINSKNINPL
jgi:hypothetical protein